MIPCVDSESRRNADGAEYTSYAGPLSTQRLREKLTIAIAMLTISEKKETGAKVRFGGERRIKVSC